MKINDGVVTMMIMISTQRLTGGDLGMDSGQYGARAVPQHCLVIHLNFYTMIFFTLEKTYWIMVQCGVQCTVYSVWCTQAVQVRLHRVPCALCNVHYSHSVQ